MQADSLGTLPASRQAKPGGWPPCPTMQAGRPTLDCTLAGTLGGAQPAQQQLAPCQCPDKVTHLLRRVQRRIGPPPSKGMAAARCTQRQAHSPLVASALSHLVRPGMDFCIVSQADRSEVHCHTQGMLKVALP